MIVKDKLKSGYMSWYMLFLWLRVIGFGIMFAFIVYLVHDNMDNTWCYLKQIGLFRTSIVIVGFLSMIFTLIALATGLTKNPIVNGLVSIMFLLIGLSGWFIADQYLAMAYQALSVLVLVYLNNDSNDPVRAAIKMNEERDAKAIEGSDEKRKE